MFGLTALSSASLASGPTVSRRDPREVFTLDYKPESRAAIERTGLRIIERLALPRGRHQVRFVVSQPNGKTGSVVADVESPDYTRTPLVMSGIVIASQQMAAQRTVDSDARLKSILSSDPTTVRRFARPDVLTAFAEVYLDGKDPRTLEATSGRGTATRQVPFSIIAAQ